jgi:iron complex outermembrane receptor protein
MSALMTSTSAWAQTAATSDIIASEPTTNGDIVVTARRRAEALQNVPVAVTVLNAETLATRGVHTESDLQLAMPGLIVRSGNNNNQLNYIIRGESMDAYSGSPPGVQPYLNEVPSPVNSSTPFYDLENVQAVKGPQGTLFGRNSTGGAVLFQTQQPKNEFGGYASVQYGNLNRLITEAAVNIPVISDKLMVRFSGTVTSGGAFVRNLYDGRLLGDKQERSGRVSIEFHLSPELINQTMVQITGISGTSAPNTAFYVIPCGQPSGFNSCTYSPNNQPFFSQLLAGQIFPGYPGGYVYPGGFQTLSDFQRSQGSRVVDQNSLFNHQAHSEVVINKTSLNVSDLITIKNIFGYTNSVNKIEYDTDYSPYPFIQQYAPNAALSGAPLPIETGETHTLSDELQLQGHTTDERLNYILGVFYIKSTEDYFSPLWIGAFNATVAYNARTGNNSTAVFGQATYKLTDNLNITLGGRYTWEKISVVQLSRSLFGAGSPQSATQQNPSWTASLDYHVNPGLMIYAATRGSWRRGGFNPFNPPTLTPMTAAQATGGNYFLAETIRDVEAGVKFNGRIGEVPLRANLAVYNSWIVNIQKTAYVVIGGTVSSATVNVPKTNIYGLEADINLQPTPWLQLGASATYTHARFTKATSLLFGNSVTYGPFADAPEYSVSLYADTKFELPRELGLLAYHMDLYTQSQVFFSNLGSIQPGTTLPAYTLVNARLDWSNMFKTKLKGSLFVKNMFDTLYYTGGSAGAQNFSNESASFGLPRTYGIQIRIDF